VLPWWGWVVFWAVLVGGSVLWLALLVRGMWGKATALGVEVSRASALVAALESRADEMSEVDPTPTAVTQPPHRLREEYRVQRAHRRAERRSRQAQRMPPWARVD
jgi:hypothetical protein